MSFWENVAVAGPDDCWLWLGHLNKEKGYGKAWDSKAKVHRNAHRIAAELAGIAFQEGDVTDHLCRVRQCCNPAHLEAVTPLVNAMRGESFSATEARQTECLRGHPFDSVNTHIRIRDGRPRRECIQCRRLRDRIRRPAQKAGPQQ